MDRPPVGRPFTQGEDWRGPLLVWNLNVVCAMRRTGAGPGEEAHKWGYTERLKSWQGMEWTYV